MTLMPVSSNTFEPTEWFEHHTIRGAWYGYTEDFRKYPNITFLFDPFEASTHVMTGWRMNFKQKTRESRMYLHFHNKKNFGFRIRLPKKEYKSIESIFLALQSSNKYDIYLSDKAVTNVVERHIYVTKEVVKTPSFEEVMAAERNRIFTEIGDYRGSTKELPDNVIDFSEYLREPTPVVSTENFAEELVKKLG